MLSDSELISIIKSHRDNSLGGVESDLAAERAKALDHYHGRPYGDEVEGRSQVVSKDLSETVDWIMPQILNVFVKSGNIAEFLPVGPEDEDLAQQESDYTNRVIMQDNNGFLLLHDAFKDALLLKNGYWKHYCDETETVKEEEYEGLTEDELLRVFADLEQDGAEVKVKEQEVKQLQTPMGVIPVFDVCLEIKRKEKKICVEAVPCEEVRVSRHCRGSLQDSPFTEHVTVKHRTDLIDMGMPVDFVDSLAAMDSEDSDYQSTSRDSVSDEYDANGLSVDRSMDLIQYCEAYIRVDYDGDGRAELRKVVTVSDRIPPGDEWNEVIEAVPMTGCVPKRVPHRHVGESLDDELEEVQKIKTILQRQMLDNIYRTNNAEKVVNQRVHMPDMLQSLPGGIKRVLDDMPVMGAVEYIQTPSILAQILPAIDYFDNVKASRTGVSDANTGLDPDVLREATKGAYMESVRQANQKIEMIARMLAETGVKELVKQVHGLIMRHSDKSRIVKMRGQYVQVNPAEWRERNDLVVKVGIGTGSNDEKRQNLMMIQQAQGMLMQMGLVGPRQAYNLFKDFAKALSFDNPEKFALDPDSEEFHQMMQQQAQGQQQPNPLAEAEQIKGQYQVQLAQEKAQFDAQIKSMQEEYKHNMELIRMEAQMLKDSKDRESKEAIEILKAEVQAYIAGLKLDVGEKGVGAELTYNPDSQHLAGDGFELQYDPDNGGFL